MAQIVVSNTLLVSANLAEALALVDQRMAGWASNSGAYDALLQQVFSRAGSDPALWQQAATALQSTLQSPGLAISLEVLNNEQLSGVNGGYTANASVRGERVYLNAAWLQTVNAAQIEAVLLEELDHAIDTRLNGNADSPGDEGERFSSLLRGVQPSAHSSSENDLRQLIVDNNIISIEAADITPPVARSGSNPAFAAAITNPFGIGDVGSNASPSFVDIDGDGDLDALIGNFFGNTLFFRNTATSGTSTPAFAAATTNPFGLGGVGFNSSPSFVDIDSDGDLDAFIGNQAGSTLFLRNTANPGASIPAFSAETITVLGLGVVGFNASPGFVDIDGDGDLDAFIASGIGDVYFFYNTATQGATSPAFADGITNPFGIENVGNFADLSFVDIDSDGDLDAFIGSRDGITRFFRNTTTLGASTPALAAATTTSFGLSDVVGYAKPSFVDIDGDGDLDGLIGDGNGNTLFFQNTTPSLGVNSITANGIYTTGSVITLTVRFSEAVVVTGAPRLQLETGAIDRFATFSGGSGSDTLTFSYTVQAGDNTSDLDLVSPNALSLNGGTIRDAAGNSANLLLVSPGAAGSLGYRKNLVIAGAIATSVSSITPNGSYTLGAVISITVTFSQAVVVTGIPRLGLETGEIDRFATYTSGSGTNTLTFAYSVQAGDITADLDNISTTALILNGGSIRDAAFSNNASLVLPTPGGPGSLAANKNLLVDAQAPVARRTDTTFAGASINPFGLTPGETASAPAFVDIDGDGDLDIFIGTSFGETAFLRNTAANGSRAPMFASAEINPFGITDVGYGANPVFVDIDRDNDLDLLIGTSLGDSLFFRNIAGSGSTTPAFAAAIVNPFGLTNVGEDASPRFVDIDRDGDLDAFIGTGTGTTLFFRNTAVSSSTTPAFAAAISNPFGLVAVGYGINPSFADIDSDGDLDGFFGLASGNAILFRNTAAPGSSIPAFVPTSTTPLVSQMWAFQPAQT